VIGGRRAKQTGEGDRRGIGTAEWGTQTREVRGKGLDYTFCQKPEEGGEKPQVNTNASEITRNGHTKHGVHGHTGTTPGEPKGKRKHFHGS